MPSTARKKPASEPAPLLALGAHPDDVEFGCGAVLVQAARAGRPVHVVVCTRGESASHGTPAVRAREARRAAARLGATFGFLILGRDAGLEARPDAARALAGLIRRLRPELVLAPTLEGNQHPDHAVLGRLARDAARLARFGGLAGLRAAPHAIGQLFHYAVTPDAEPSAGGRIVVDVSAPEVIAAWTAAMAAHASQLRTRNYVELQLARARVLGLQAGVEHAQALFPASAPLVTGLGGLTRAARRF
jgi:LmbE family N-acetylglucosaminyl deacetylase